MRLGLRLRRALPPTLVAALVAAPALSGCGLFDRGSEVEEAFEYLPADTFEVRFTSGGLDDDVDTSELARYAQVLADAPFGPDHVDWEASASWGSAEDTTGTATIWKVDDDLDFEALADDLEDKGYVTSSAGTMQVYTVDLSAADDGATIGGTYPVPLLLNLLLAEDEQVVAASARGKDPLLDVAAVIAEDDDSLADDGAFEDLLDAADGDPDIAWLTEDGPALCGGMVGRGLFLSEEEDVRLVLQHDDEDAAEDDLETRTDLVETGADPATGRPFDELGDVELERDGDRVLIEMDFTAGPRVAFQAEAQGGGPGACDPAAG